MPERCSICYTHQQHTTAHNQLEDSSCHTHLCVPCEIILATDPKSPFRCPYCTQPRPVSAHAQLALRSLKHVTAGLSAIYLYILICLIIFNLPAIIALYILEQTLPFVKQTPLYSIAFAAAATIALAFTTIYYTPFAFATLIAHPSLTSPLLFAIEIIAVFNIDRLPSFSFLH